MYAGNLGKKRISGLLNKRRGGGLYQIMTIHIN